MKTKTVKFRVGDIVRHDNKKYIVSETKSWVHKDGWISLCRNMGEMSLLTRVDLVKLILPREKNKKSMVGNIPRRRKIKIK